MNTKPKDLRALAERAIPFLRDEGAKYEDDGSNEPLELARDIEEALSENGGGGEAVAPDEAWRRWVSSKEGGFALMHGEVRPYRTHFNAGWVAGFNARLHTTPPPASQSAEPFVDGNGCIRSGIEPDASQSAPSEGGGEGWHFAGCTGECLACLIERSVRRDYGTQGLDYLHRRLSTAGQVPDGMFIVSYLRRTENGCEHVRVNRAEWPEWAEPLNPIATPEQQG